MAYSLNFSNANKEIKFNDLLGFPVIDYSRFIGVKDKQIIAFDESTTILGKSVGIEGEVRLTAGLDLQAKLDLGSLNLVFPWKQGGLNFKLVGNQLELRSSFNANNILPSIDFNAPEYKLYTGFEVGIGGYLDGKLGGNRVTLVPEFSTQEARIRYPILDYSSQDSSNPNNSGQNEVELPAAVKEAGFKINLDYPDTTDEVLNILKSGLQVSSQGINLSSKIPIVTLEADLVRVLSNIPILKPFLTVLSGNREYADIFEIDWKLLTATLNGGINLQLNTGIAFGDLVATLEFEDGTVSSKIPLTASILPKIDLGSNPLARLNKNGDNAADIKLTIGFDTPKLTASAGLYADLYSNLIIGQATATVEALGQSKSFKVGPLYEQRFDIATLPIPYLSTGNIEKTLPANLAPLLSFTVPLALSNSDNPLATLQSDTTTALSVVPDSIPIVEVLEKQGNIILAKKLEGNRYDYVLYKASELTASDNPIDPYNRSDLLTKAIYLTGISEPKDTLDNTPYENYRPIGAEIDDSGNYTVIFSQMLPPIPVLKDSQAFKVWTGNLENGQPNNQFEQTRSGSEILRYEAVFQQDLNGTGYIEPGELIAGFVLGRGLWRNNQGYWVGQAQEFPSNYLDISDPNIGEPIQFIAPSLNILNSQYEGVLFKQGDRITLRSIDVFNQRVGRDEEVSSSDIGSFERALDQDLNGDGFVGTINVVDNDIDKSDYTFLLEFIEPVNPDDPSSDTYRAKYVVQDDDIQVIVGTASDTSVFPVRPVINQTRTANIFLKADFATFKGNLEYYFEKSSGKFLTSSYVDSPGRNWKAIAASLNVGQSMSDRKIIDVMWKSLDAQTPRWFNWKFEARIPSGQVNSLNIDAIATDRDRSDAAIYLNTSEEVAVYESQFSEDFNQDGFIGVTNSIEQAGDTMLVLVNFTEEAQFEGGLGETKITYQLKEKDAIKGKKIFSQGFEVTSASLWKPIAVERAFVQLLQFPLAYYYAIGKNDNNTYSLWILDQNGSRIADHVIASEDLNTYEVDFKQDLNQDGVLNAIVEAVDVIGIVNLFLSSTGYVIDEQWKKQYLKLQDGTQLTEAIAKQLGINPLQIEKMGIGYQLLQSRNGGTVFELAMVDATGTIRSTQPISYSEIPSAFNFRPPVLSNISKSSNQDSVISFTAPEFSSAFSDPDGNALVRIQISTLPESGSLKLDGINVVEGQEIDIRNLSKLSFQPNAQFRGKVSFTWNGFDGATYADTAAQVNLTIGDVIAPTPDTVTQVGPTVRDIIAPTVDILEVTPNPRLTAINRITIQFSEAVKEFDTSDLILRRNNIPLSLSNTILTTTDNRTWMLGNLDSLTDTPGLYQLAFKASDITDSAGNTLVDTDTEAWTTKRFGMVPRPISFSQGMRGVYRRGSKGADTLRGSYKNDVLFGLDGNDRLYSGSGRPKFGQDRLYGDSGNDELIGGRGNDRLYGGKGRDCLRAGKGDDFLLGGNGNDALIGGDGNDILVGGLGVNLLWGGTGQDTFTFNSLKDGTDMTNDFSANDDLIDLRPIFTQPQFSHSDLLTGFSQFIRLVQVGVNSELQIDSDGNGIGLGFVTLAIFKNVSSGDMNSSNFLLA